MARGSVARLLPQQNPEELKAAAAQLVEFTRSAVPDVRQSAWAGLVLADGSFERKWAQVAKTEGAFADFLESIALLPDQDFRAKAFDQAKALLEKRSPEPVQQGAIHALVSMHRDYETVFRLLTGLIERNESVRAAAQGLLALPRSKWPREQAGAAATGLVAWARTIPADGRTSRDYLQVVQLAGDLAGLMAKEQAAGLRKQLSELRVALFVVRSVREQMRYDTTRLVVEAGKPFEIIFENPDFMPHNLVVVQPNAREKLGAATATMKPDQLDSEGRAYLPPSSDIIGATKILQAGQSESLKLTAPAKEGNYEYFCSYPAHYQLMWGNLIVTKDVDAYLQQHPEAPIPPPPPVSSEEGAPDTAHKHSH
jgi:azurin